MGRRSPSVAAVLSFAWPGLGQWYAQRRRTALAFAVPALAVVLLLLWQLRDGPAVLAARLFSSGLAFSVILTILALAAWRIVAIAHAFVVSRPADPRRRPAQAAVLAALLLAVVGMHAFAATYVESFVRAGDEAFQTAGPMAVASGALPTPSESLVIADPSGSAEPLPTAPPNSSRITVLLTGIDSAAGRTTQLNDTLLVVSVDTTAKTVSMLSVPRDSAGFPLYFGGRVAPTFKINALATYVALGWIKSPDDPMTTLAKEVGYLVGVPIQYYAQIDIAGFARLVDMVGGVDVDNPADIADPRYDWLDGSPDRGFSLSKGRHHLNGRLALAYVRSRQGVGDSDYTRSARQQQVLQQIQKKMSEPAMVLRVPDLLKAAAPMIRTNLPRDRVGDLVALANGFPEGAATKCVLAAPYTRGNATPELGVWTSRLDLERVKRLSVSMFGRDSAWFGRVEPEPCASKVRGI